MIQYNYRTMTADAVRRALDAAAKANLGHRRHEDPGGRRQFQEATRRRSSRSSSTRASRSRQAAIKTVFADQRMHAVVSEMTNRDHAPREHRRPAATTRSPRATRSCWKSTGRRPRTSTATAAATTASRRPAASPSRTSSATSAITRSTASASGAASCTRPSARGPRPRRSRPGRRPGRLPARTSRRRAPPPRRREDGLEPFTPGSKASDGAACSGSPEDQRRPNVRRWP